jgi:hypothetical protein
VLILWARGVRGVEPSVRLPQRAALEAVVRPWVRGHCTPQAGLADTSADRGQSEPRPERYRPTASSGRHNAVGADAPDSGPHDGPNETDETGGRCGQRSARPDESQSTASSPAPTTILATRSATAEAGSSLGGPPAPSVSAPTTASSPRAQPLRRRGDVRVRGDHHGQAHVRHRQRLGRPPPVWRSVLPAHPRPAR